MTVHLSRRQAGWACVLVNAAGDICRQRHGTYSRTHTDDQFVTVSNSAVHMLLAEWTLVPAHLFAGLRCRSRLWRARFVLAGGVCSGSLRTQGTRCAIWQSLFAALHFWGECNRGFLLGPCQNFLTHFVYDGLLGRRLCSRRRSGVNRWFARRAI